MNRLPEVRNRYRSTAVMLFCFCAVLAGCSKNTASIHARDKPVYDAETETISITEREVTADILNLCIDDYHDVILPSDYSAFSSDYTPPMISEEEVEKAVMALMDQYDYEEEGSKAAEYRLTDSWAAENTDYNTAVELRAGIRTDLEKTAVRKADSARRQQLLKQLVESSEVVIPEEVISARVSEMTIGEKAIAGYMGQSYEQYVLDETGLSLAEYEASLSSTAEEELHRKRIIAAFAAAEAVDVSEKAWTDFLNEEADFYGYRSGAEYLNELEQIGLREYLQTRFLEKQAADVLVKMSQNQDDQ